MDIEEGLMDLFNLHSGYVSIILQDKENGRESDPD